MIVRLIALILMCNIAFAQKCKLVVYAYPINTFTKIPITKSGIKDAYEFKRKAKNKDFTSSLEKVLATKKVVTTPSEMNNVRILIEIYSGQNTDEVVIDKGTVLCYKNQCYELDQELLAIVLELFPKEKHNDYIPMKFKKAAE